MLFDAAGNLYGGTSGGGLYASGTIFEFTRDSSGKWEYHNIFNFTGNGPTTDLVMDPEGNLYGAGYSAVFELSPQGDTVVGLKLQAIRLLPRTASIRLDG